jgi:tRNA (guanine-N7-)-methyltransferase
MPRRIPLVIESNLRLDPERALDGVDWSRDFGGPGPVEVEIGIGKGRFLLKAAAARPDVRMLGVEWANHYLRIAESRAEKRGLENVRFLRVDALKLLETGIPSDSVNCYYVFYPDPWPKTRHHKRRFFQSSTLDQVARTLVPGGCLHAATDHELYWEIIEPLMDGRAEFEGMPEFGGEDFPLPPGEPLTNYETKYLMEGRKRLRGSWRLKG